MKKLFLIITCIIMSSNCFHTSVYAKDVETIVFIAQYGSKYHDSKCQYLYNSYTAIFLEDAINQGYEKCSKCFLSKTKNKEKVDIVEVTTHYNSENVVQIRIIKLTITIIVLSILYKKIIKRKRK